MLRLFCVSGLAALCGCGLIDTNITDVDLSLPEKQLTVDSAQWQLSAGEMPPVPCADDAQACAAAVSDYCGAEELCLAMCNAETETCELEVAVSLWHTFDLAAEKPELQEIDDQPLVSVEVGRVTYDVRENTLSADSPPLAVYLAPQGVMSPSDSQAKLVGTIPSVPAMTTVTDAELELTPAGRDVLAQYLADYDTPFNLIVGGGLAIGAGDAMPTGKLVAVVKATATAGL